MAPTKGTPVRTVRVPDELWQAALAKAAERGELIGDVIRAGLQAYVDDPAQTPDRSAP